jgi:hypothetical protein
VIKTQSDYDQRYPDVPLNRWKANVVEAVKRIGDQDHQSSNWLRDDRPAWENPNEVINVLTDDSQFNLFLTDCAYSFSDQQRQAAEDFSTKLNRFVNDTPESLGSKDTLNDPRWEEIRTSANTFVAAFSIQ